MPHTTEERRVPYVRVYAIQSRNIVTHVTKWLLGGSDIPEVHEQPAAGVGRIDPPIGADLLPLKLVSRLRQAEVHACHAPDGARVYDRLDVHELGEISSIVPAAVLWGKQQADGVIRSATTKTLTWRRAGLAKRRQVLGNVSLCIRAP